MSAITRLGEAAYGVRRYAVNAFAGKAVASVKISRLGEAGYGVRRYANGAFANKAPFTPANGVPLTQFICNTGRMLMRGVR